MGTLLDTSASDVLNFAGSGDTDGDAVDEGTVSVDLEAQTVAQATFDPVSYLGIETINLNAGGLTPNVQATSVDDDITVTVYGAQSGKIERGEGGLRDLDLLESVARNINGKTLCPFGEAEVAPVLSTLQHFRHEYEAHVREGRCPLHADWRRGA